MGNSDMEDYDAELLGAAAGEAQLVWNRYGHMLIAHGIVLAVIGTAAFGNEKSHAVILAGSFFGLILTIPWFVLTAVGWSLEYVLLLAISWKTKMNGRRPVDAFLGWGAKTGTPGSQDLIWWSGHFVIAVFWVAYTLIFGYEVQELCARDPDYKLDVRWFSAVTLSVAYICPRLGFEWALRQPSLWNSLEYQKKIEEKRERKEKEKERKKKETEDSGPD